MLAEQIMERVRTLPEGAPIRARLLLDLGARAAVNRTLSRLARAGRLLRASRGLYLCPVTGRFGARAPAVDKVVRAIAGQRGEIVASHGATAANALGLTTQVPVRLIYLTDGPSRRLQIGAQTVELRHAPGWQLRLADQAAGQALRALAWLGPEKAAPALEILKARSGPAAFADLVAAAPRRPNWLARAVRRAARD